VLVNIHHDSAREHNRLFVAGIASILVIALLIWFSIAIYNKKFDRVTMVTVKAERAGLQLAKFGDVRVNGALVGQVREVTQDGEQAEIRVALEPSAAKTIPSNSSVQIMPTTLFGQKFVSFVRPDAPSGKPLADGDVIPAERVETNVELSQVLADLFPLLRAVRPADLNATLNALATALEGRGDQIGQTMDELGQYLDAIDDHLPTLRQDLVELAEVADAYDLAAPDLLGVLANVTVTSKTIVQKQRELDVFFSDLGGLAKTSHRILRDNEQNLVRVGQVTEPVLALLAEYSPEFPCLIKGAANYAPILSKTFEGDWVKQYIEFFQPQSRVFDKRDAPRYGEVGRGPECYGLPKFTVPGKPRAFDQGSPLDENPPRSPVPNFGSLPPDWLNLTSGYAGTEADRQVVNALLASRTGRDSSAYGSLGSLLYGSVLRDGEAQG
jgi:phospholipid/cholesterol/gamma-HCH transport system substrate-binding protein